MRWISFVFLSFYFNSPKEKISQKTPKNAKNLTKLLKLRCANFLKEQFYDFFPDFPKRRLPWKTLKKMKNLIIVKIKKSIFFPDFPKRRLPWKTLKKAE